MLSKKIKEFRISNKMTQSELAKELGVSSQTVSKWERGLLSPDVSLLPDIANVFRCSIDKLFDRDIFPTANRFRDFYLKIGDFDPNNDWDTEYNAWIEEIRNNPDEYLNYLLFINRIYAKKDFSENHLFEIIKLAEMAEKNCDNIDIKNGINYAMVHICAESNIEWFMKKTESYYKKLPQLRHGRDPLIKYILSGEKLRNSQMFNVSLSAQQLCEAIVELCNNEEKQERKIYYYKKAAGIYEVLLESKFGGRYEEQLLNYYFQIALLSEETDSKKYIDKIITTLERHFDKEKTKDTTLLLYAADRTLNEITPFAKSLLELMLHDEKLKSSHKIIAEFKERYFEYFNEK